jgi:PE family
MSSVIAAPELITAAATDLANIGSTLNAAHLAAAPATIAMVPAAADEVSAGIAYVFSEHGQDYQAMAGKALAFQEQFAQHLTVSAGLYAAAEAANVALFQPLTAIAGSVASASAGLQDLLGNLIVQLQNLLWNALTILPYPIQALLGVGAALIVIALIIVFALINSVFGTHFLEGFSFFPI